MKGSDAELARAPVGRRTALPNPTTCAAALLGGVHMAEPATSGQWLYFRVLAEPNPDRGGLRVWRLHELARRATQLSRREHTTSVVTGSLYTCLKKKGLAEAYSDGRRCTLWRLTAKVRRRSRRRDTHLAQTLMARGDAGLLTLALRRARRTGSGARAEGGPASRHSRRPASHGKGGSHAD